MFVSTEEGETSMLFAPIAGVPAVSFLLSICVAQAQTGPSPERLNAIQQTMANVKQEAISKLPPHLQMTLSGSALNFLQLATA
jgi:hypothetical protein